MAKVFISYRRNDSSGEARQLHHDLTRRLVGADVFLDAEDAEYGRFLRDSMAGLVSSSDALVVLLGKEWLSRQNRKRLNQKADIVRLELATALEAHVFILPVLLDGARRPSENELPKNIEKFAEVVAVSLPHDYWDEGITRIVAELDQGRRSPGSLRLSISESIIEAGRVACYAFEDSDEPKLLERFFSIDELIHYVVPTFNLTAVVHGALDPQGLLGYLALTSQRVLYISTPNYDAHTELSYKDVVQVAWRTNLTHLGKGRTLIVTTRRGAHEFCPFPNSPRQPWTGGGGPHPAQESVVLHIASHIASKAGVGVARAGD